MRLSLILKYFEARFSQFRSNIVYFVYLYIFDKNMLNVILFCFHSFLLYNPTVADSGTVVTVSAMFRAEILNFLAKQNLQKGMSSSSPKTLSAFLGPEIILSMLSLQMISLRAHMDGTLNIAVSNNENSFSEEFIRIS